MSWVPSRPHMLPLGRSHSGSFFSGRSPTPRFFSRTATSAMAGHSVVSKGRTRTSSPAELTVGALELKFEDYMEAMKSRDFSSLLKDLKQETTWKNAPKASVLGRYSVLFSGLADVCPCGVLPPKKTTLALLACHRKRPINFSGQADVDWADEMGTIVRAAFAKFRELSCSQDACRRCLAKASTHDKLAIEEVLAKMGGPKTCSEMVLYNISDKDATPSARQTPGSHTLDSLSSFFEAMHSELDSFSVVTPRGAMSITPRSTGSFASTVLYDGEDKKVTQNPRQSEL